MSSTGATKDVKICSCTGGKSWISWKTECACSSHLYNMLEEDSDEKCVSKCDEGKMF